MPAPWWNWPMNTWQWPSFAGLLFPLAIWSLFWTGFALWHAARRGEKWWFIIFLIIHTAGILEIIYLLFVAHAFSTSARSSRRR